MSRSPTSTRSALRAASVWAAVLIVAGALLYMVRVPEALHWPVRLLTGVSVLWLGWVTWGAVRGMRFEPRRIVFSLILVGMLYGALVLVCAVFIKLMSRKDERLTTVNTTSLSPRVRRGIEAMLRGESHSMYDREIGWVPQPGFRWHLYSVNEQGVRGSRVYPMTAPDPDRRILCLGDSFTFGFEVADDETFPHHGEQLRPGTEWINLGINGSGLVQSLHHYRKNGRRFGGRHVVIAFMTHNAKRTVNCFRPFISPDDLSTPFTKPFAKFAGGRFSLEPNPYQDLSDYRRLLANEREELARLAELDYLTWSSQHGSGNPVLRTLGYVRETREVDRNWRLLLGRPAQDGPGRLDPAADPYGNSIWHPRSLGFQANLRLFDLYYSEVQADGRVPLIVILPSAQDVEERAEGRPARYRALLDHFRRKDYRHLDFLEVLASRRKAGGLTKEAIYVDTHFRGEINRELAAAIVEALPL